MYIEIIKNPKIKLIFEAFEILKFSLKNSIILLKYSLFGFDKNKTN